MAGTSFSIGDLAARTGCKVQTIRYYESIGLLPAPARTSGNQRRYGQAHLNRLAFVRHARDLGFPLGAVRELLELADHPERPCDAADRIARRRLAEVRRRMAQLAALEAELERMLGECAGDRIASCRIIEVLADHEQCLHESHKPPPAPAT